MKLSFFIIQKRLFVILKGIFITETWNNDNIKYKVKLNAANLAKFF